MDVRNLSIGIVSLALLAGAGAWTLAQPDAPKPAGQAQPPKGPEKDEDGEEVITLDKAPEAVRAAAVKHAGDAKNITKVVKEEDEEDVVRYEVEYTEGTGAGAIKCAAIFSPAGDLMETEKATTEAKLPAAALEALKKEYPKATFADPEVVTKTYYEVQVVVKDKKRTVKVDAAGGIEDESEHGDGDKEHGKGEEKGEKHEGKEKKGKRD